MIGSGAGVHGESNPCPSCSLSLFTARVYLHVIPSGLGLKMKTAKMGLFGNNKELQFRTEVLWGKSRKSG